MAEIRTPGPDEPFALSEAEEESLLRPLRELQELLKPPTPRYQHEIARGLGAAHYAEMRDMLVRWND